MLGKRWVRGSAALWVGLAGHTAFAQIEGAGLARRNWTAQFLTLQPGATIQDSATAAAATTLPTWTGSFVFAGKTYPYRMVGTNPALGSQTTSVPVLLIPLKFVFSDGTILDPTALAFGSSNSALRSTLLSPVFQPASFAPGGTNVGTTQYADAFQRANFWSEVSTISPNYHVLIQPFALPSAVAINVPAASGNSTPGPGARIGQVNLAFINRWLNLALPNLTFVHPNILVVFLTYNTFFTQGGSCCVVGFHGATSLNPTTAQTFIVAAYNDAGVFNVPLEDIHALSHEIGEWMDDPLGNNPVPGWSAGQSIGSCQTNLETGDPVTGVAFAVFLNGMTYHPEDLVFLPWFARQTPSTSVNGWYTFLNSFPSPPAVCP